MELSDEKTAAARGDSPLLAPLPSGLRARRYQVRFLVEWTRGLQQRAS